MFLVALLSLRQPQLCEPAFGAEFDPRDVQDAGGVADAGAASVPPALSERRADTAAPMSFLGRAGPRSRQGRADGCGPGRRTRPIYGRMAKARAGKPKPFSTFGQVTTMIAPVAGT